MQSLWTRPEPATRVTACRATVRMINLLNFAS